MSKFSVEIVPVIMEPHGNADKLSIVRVRGFQCVVNTADWTGVELAAYVPPDSVVDSSRPEFSFLKGSERIRVRKFRGVISQGLLVPAPKGMKVGDDASEILGVTHYEPPIRCATDGTMAAPPVGIIAPVYDVENYRRYTDKIAQGEQVVITEKIHGASARYVFDGDVFHVGSRTNWWKEDGKNIWWRAFRNTPFLEDWMRRNAGIVVYGEVFGKVQSLKYGIENDVSFRAFDLMRNGFWIDFEAAKTLWSNDDLWVPVIFRGPFDPAAAVEMAEGNSLIASHIREGCVVRPIIERRDDEIGRIQLKIVGNKYLEKEF